MEKKNLLLKDISIFLYAFGLALVQYTLFELVLTNLTITDYRMNFTIGVLIAVILISFATVVYMSERFEGFRKLILDTKINRYSTVFGLISTVILAFMFLNFTIAHLGIVPILIMIIGSFVVARLLENIAKKNLNK